MRRFSNDLMKFDGFYNGIRQFRNSVRIEVIDDLSITCTEEQVSLEIGDGFITYDKVHQHLFSDSNINYDVEDNYPHLTIKFNIDEYDIDINIEEVINDPSCSSVWRISLIMAGESLA